MAKTFRVSPKLASMWFPAALALLLLLALPGIILLAMNLFGMENAVNGWMQEKFNLSYHIPIPRWASILLVWLGLGPAAASPRRT